MNPKQYTSWYCVILLAGALLAPAFTFAQAALQLVMANDPSENLWSSSGDGVRGVIAGSDLDQDGRYEIIATDYSEGGRVHIYEVYSHDQMLRVWSSPGTGANSSNHCRFVQTGDLDGNGRGEIVIAISEEATNQNGKAGLHIFEWDGQTDNGYGSSPLLITRLVDPLLRFRVEHFLIADLDDDGAQEILVPLNSEANEDFFLILSVRGTFSAGNAVWLEEARYQRGQHFDGDAMNVVVADMDGDGYQEAVFHAWKNMTCMVVEATGSHTYKTGNAYTFGLGNKNDVCLHNGVAADFDRDGKDEVYFNSWKFANLYMLSGGDDATQLGPEKVRLLSTGGMGGAFQSFGMAVSHGDAGAQPALFIGSGGAQGDILQFTYVGGDVRDSTSYVLSTVYHDTTDGESILSKIAFAGNDLDGDSFPELIAGYQNIPLDHQPKLWLRVLEPGIVVPVELSRFVFADGELRWTTVSESNNFGFEVQRASPGAEFVRIGFVPGAGTTTVPQRYRFRDKLSTGTWRYRLKQIDTDGTFQFSQIVEAVYSNVPENILLQNYPNPLRMSGVTISVTQIEFEVKSQYSTEQQHVRLTIFNALGQLVKILSDQPRPPGRYQVMWRGDDIWGRPVASGVYFYQFEIGGQKVTRRMLLVR